MPIVGTNTEGVVGPSVGAGGGAAAVDPLLTGITFWTDLQDPPLPFADLSGTNAAITIASGTQAVDTTNMKLGTTCMENINTGAVRRIDDNTFDFGDTDFTIAIWARTGVAAINGHGPVGKRFGSNGWAFIENTDASMTFHVGAGSASTAILTASTWYWLLGTYNAATDTISVAVNNGTPVTASLAGGAPAHTTGLYLGAVSSSSTRWNGLVQQFIAWNRVITSAEEDRVYNSGAGMLFPS